MTATNHAISGAVIGLLIGDAAIALPVSFFSHFVLDSMPHFDMNGVMSVEKWVGSKTFLRFLGLDILGCIIVELVLLFNKPHHWILAGLCAFLATLPDALWLRVFIIAKRHKKWHPNMIERFCGKIQWFARPIGSLVEITWLVCGAIVLSILVR